MRELNDLLTQVTDKMREVRSLHPYLDKLQNLEQAELKELIDLCEESSDSVFRFRQKVKYLQLNRSEGRLALNPDGHFTVGERELTKGDYLEIFVPVSKEERNAGWQFGQIEHDGKKYYFSGQRVKLPLKEGMLAAVRAKENPRKPKSK